jgi:hypothetical protein
MNENTKKHRQSRPDARGYATVAGEQLSHKSGLDEDPDRRRREQNHPSGDAPPRSGEHLPSDHGWQADNGQVLSEKPEPLGKDGLGQRRGMIHPLGDPQLSLGLPGLGREEVVKLIELRNMLQMRQPGREREAATAVGASREERSLSMDLWPAPGRDAHRDQRLYGVKFCSVERGLAPVHLALA